MSKKFINKEILIRIKHNLISIKHDVMYYLFKYFPVLITTYNHYSMTGKLVNLRNPKTFNEKLEWLKIHYKNKNISLCTDKFEVREYVKRKCNDKILNDLLSIYNNVEDIDWEKLPNAFVIKCTHGSGYNIIISDVTLCITPLHQ